MRDRRVLGERHLEPGQRVVGHVQAEHLALEGELVLLGPLGPIGHLGGRDLLDVVVEAVEVEADRAGRLLALRVDRRLRGIFMDLQQRATGRAERVERTRLDERLDGALVRRRRGTFAR